MTEVSLSCIVDDALNVVTRLLDEVRRGGHELRCSEFSLHDCGRHSLTMRIGLRDQTPPEHLADKLRGICLRTGNANKLKIAEI